MSKWIFGFAVLASVLLYLSALMARIARRRANELESANQRLIFENQERRRAEEKVAQLNRDLQRKLDEFRTLLDVLPIGIAVAEDPECRHIWTNRALAAMLQIAEGGNISLSVSETEKPPYRLLRNGADVPPADLPIQAAARTKAPIANDYLDIARADGTVLHTLSYSAPLFDENGAVRGVIDACVDITERKLLEDRLQQAEKYQSLALMAGGIAHDFNNLLTVIIGNAARASMEVLPGSTAGRAIEDLQAAATEVARLVAQLMAFTGRFWCQIEPIALSAEIEKNMPHLRTLVPAPISIDYDLSADLPLIEAGATELRQVMDSLILNAVEAMGGSNAASIRIRTRHCELSAADLHYYSPDHPLQPGTYVRLEISDTGCGMPDHILKRVFDPFFTTKFVGRGLGLSAVQGIVRAHRGAIHLESTLDRGTTVELIIPALARGSASTKAATPG